MKLIFLLATLALLVAGTLDSPAQAQKHRLPAGAMDARQLDETVDRYMREAGIAGLGAAILVDRQVVWMKGYGFADEAGRRPFTPDTVMNIGSISKTVTGVALMRAVQEGRLSLDADINTYLPFKVRNPKHPQARITLRQLATHTSGITDRTTVYRASYRYGDAAPEPLGAFLENYFVPGGAHYAAENFLDAKPGTHREYSNIGAGLAGYIVEQATGATLGDYARRRVFEPLGMRNTGWSAAEVDKRRRSTLYVAQYGLTVPIPFYEVATYPDGGVHTSVADLSRLFAALLNDGSHDGVRILDERLAREMLRFHYTEARKPDNVDLREKNSGIFWQSKFNVTRMGHGGIDPGVNTEMLSSLSRDIGVIVFSNTSLSGEDAGAFVHIYSALWQHAEALKTAQGDVGAGLGTAEMRARK
jgi:CubicO group peptidase (beta-lactamase class C family)